MHQCYQQCAITEVANLGLSKAERGMVYIGFDELHLEPA